MQAIDTNVLVRVVARDDPKQAATADEFVKRGAWVSLLVLMEKTWVLAAVYDVGATRLAQAIEMLLEHESIVVQDSDVVRAALVDFRQRPGLGFSDCLICEVARKSGHVPLATFDRNLAKLRNTQRL